MTGYRRQTDSRPGKGTAESVASQLSSATSWRDRAERAAAFLEQSCGIEAVIISALSEDMGTVTELYSSGKAATTFPQGLSKPADGSAALFFIKNGLRELDAEELARGAEHGIGDFGRLLTLGFRSSVGCPVSLGGRSVGTLHALASKVPGRDSLESVRVVSALLAPYVEFHLATLRGQSAASRAVALEKIARCIVERKDFASLCREVVDYAGQIIGSDAVVVRVQTAESSGPSVIFSAGAVDHSQVTASSSVVAGVVIPEVIRRHSAILVDGGFSDHTNDTRLDALLEEFPSILVAPLFDANRFLGTVEFYSLNEYAYSAVDLASLDHVAALFSSAAAHHMLLNDLARQVEIRGFLAEVARTASGARDVKEAVDRILAELQAVIPFEDAIFVLPEAWADFARSATGNAVTKRVKVLQSNSEVPECASLPVSGDATHGHREVAIQCLKAQMPFGSEYPGEGWLHLHRVSGEFSPEHHDLIREVARHIAPALDSVLSHATKLALLDERKRAEGSEAEALHLRKINDTKREFISTISHELRTPLTAIRAFVDLLGRHSDEGFSPRQRNQLSVVKRNVEWLKLMTDDLLELSRIEAARFEVQPETLDVRETLHGLTISFAPLLEGKHHTLEVICPSRPLAVRADPNRLNQVLSNLLTNCIKYCPQGTKIRVLARRRGGGTCFYVRDEGPGIPESQLAQLFQLFFRADTAVSKTVTGTGIGLYVSKMIVEAHGGRIGVTSQEGKYTTVHFWLPESGPPQVEVGLQKVA